MRVALKNQIKKTATLGVEGLCVSLRLGWTPDERKRPQTIEVDFWIRFLKPLKVFRTDQLTDTFCYDLLCSKINDYCSKKEFQLIEALTFGLYEELVQNLSQSALLRIRVKKTQVPLSQGLSLKGGASFTYGDF